MKKALEKVPVWGYTLALIAACCLASVFSATVYKSLLEAYGLYFSGGVVLYVFIIGIFNGLILRVLFRAVYAVGDRLFFRLLHTVPDFNYRRLPMTYNNFVRVSMLWLTVAKLFTALFTCLLFYVVPVAYYLWQFASSIATLACIIAAYFMLDKFYVPTWQSGKCFLSLAIPTLILYGLATIL